MNNLVKILVFCCLVFAVFFVNASAQTEQNEKPVNKVINGSALSLPKPDFPDKIKKDGIGGNINVNVLIDETGKVISAKAVSGIENAELRKAAEQAALKSTFAPTLLAGKPVRVTGIIVYNFTDDVSNEDKVKVFGLGTFLFTMKNSADDLLVFHKVFESDDAIKNSIEEFSNFSGDLAPLNSLQKLSSKERLAIIEKVISSIKAKLNTSELWQFELGRLFAEISRQFINVSSEEEVDLSKFDENRVKKTLLEIKQLTLNAPPDFPADILSRIKDFSELGNKNIMSSQENWEEFMNKMEKIFETISPGSTK